MSPERKTMLAGAGPRRHRGHRGGDGTEGGLERRPVFQVRVLPELLADRPLGRELLAPGLRVVNGRGQQVGQRTRDQQMVDPAGELLFEPGLLGVVEHRPAVGRQQP
jgi:hypothetical protein